MRSRRPFHPARRRNPVAWYEIDPVAVSAQTTITTPTGQPYAIFSPDEVRAFIEYLYLVEQSCPPDVFTQMNGAAWRKGAPTTTEWFYRRALDSEDYTEWLASLPEDLRATLDHGNITGVYATLLFHDGRFSVTMNESATFLWSIPWARSAYFTRTASKDVDDVTLDDLRATGDWDETDFTFTYTRIPHPAFAEPAVVWLTMEQRELLQRTRADALATNDEELVKMLSGLRGDFLLVPWERANRWGLVFSHTVTISDDPAGAEIEHAVDQIAESWFLSRLSTPRR